MITARASFLAKYLFCCWAWGGCIGGGDGGNNWYGEVGADTVRQECCLLAIQKMEVGGAAQRNVSRRAFDETNGAKRVKDVMVFAEINIFTTHSPTNLNLMSEETTPAPGYYPGIFLRVKAIFLDSIVLVVMLYAASYLLPDNAATPLRILVFGVIFLLYDPLLTSVFGGTVGHMVMGIAVKQEKDESKNIIFPLAVVRYLLKTALGWVSLLTVGSNARRKALHDMVVGSVVVFR